MRLSLWRWLKMKKKKATKYFNDIKPKHLKEFEVTTPGKNIIKGFICRKANHFLGSLLITEVNGKKACQFVQSMPKIHYYDYKNRVFDDKDFYDTQAIMQAGLRGIVGYEKLDGSCLIIYGLYDPETNELLEIIPKSRNLPVADKVLLNMYSHIDTYYIEKYFNNVPSDYNASLMFELYGMLNRHEIYYYQTYIDIKLIGVCENGEFDTGASLKAFAGYNHFDVPQVIYSIWKNYDDNQWYIKVHGYKSSNRLSPYLQLNDSPHIDIYDCIQDIKEMLYDLNYKYVESNGHRAIEGVVFNSLNSNGEQMYIKVKPHDIEIEHKTVNGIPRRSIVKECYKYFDEYGSIVKDIYDEDDTHYIGYVSNQLLEEYPEEIVMQPKTQKKISNIFMEVWDARTVPESIQNICHDLVDNNPELDVADLMRLFSKEYPQKKKMASTVYQVISSIKKRCNNG